MSQTNMKYDESEAINNKKITNGCFQHSAKSRDLIAEILVNKSLNITEASDRNTPNWYAFIFTTIKTYLHRAVVTDRQGSHMERFTAIQKHLNAQIHNGSKFVSLSWNYSLVFS